MQGTSWLWVIWHDSSAGVYGAWHNTDSKYIQWHSETWGHKAGGQNAESGHTESKPMSNPDDLKSVFEGSSDIEMEDLSKPNHILKLKQSFQSLKSTQHMQCPIMALHIDPEPTPTVPTVVSQPTSSDISIAPIIPTDPYFLHIYDPRDHIIWERTSWKLGGEHALSG